MQNKKHLIEFIKVGMGTNSPEKRLIALYELLRVDPTLFDIAEQDDLIQSLKLIKEKKANQGLTDVSKRYNKKTTKPSKDERWVFVLKSGYSTQCAGCGNRYEIDDMCFVNYKENQTKGIGFHVDCVSAEVKNKDQKYQDYLNGGQ